MRAGTCLFLTSGMTVTVAALVIFTVSFYSEFVECFYHKRG